MTYKVFADGLFIQHNSLRHRSYVVEHDCLYILRLYKVRETVRFPDSHMISAVEIEIYLPVSVDIIQLHLSAAIGAEQESRQRIATLCFPALRYGFLHFPYLIPKLLRYDRFVRIIHRNPLALIPLIPLMVLIRNRTPALLRHMPQIGGIVQDTVHGTKRP